MTSHEAGARGGTRGKSLASFDPNCCLSEIQTLCHSIKVSSFADLQANRDRARDKIVLFNVPFTTYGETVAYRSGGADAAAAVRLLPCSPGVRRDGNGS